MNFNNIGGYRRRLMIACSGNKPPYPDPWVDDGYIWCYYNVTTTESATKLLGNTTGIGTTMNVDGVDVARATTYTFPTTGEHLVKFTPTAQSIGNATFTNVGGLVRAYLPDYITSTGTGSNNDNAPFARCSYLTLIVIPDTFTSVGKFTFSKCSRLKTVVLLATSPPTLGDYPFYQCNALEKIKVPSASVDDYKVATRWSSYASKITAI